MFRSVGSSWRRWLRFAIFSDCLLIGFPVIAAEARKQPVPHTSSAPAAPAAAGRDIVFTTDDNLVIAATYYPAGHKGEPAPAAILLHMYKGNRSDFAPLVPALRRAGFAVLAIDLRGHGGSVGQPAMKLADRVAQRDKNLFSNMHRDVTAGFSWLREQEDVDLSRFVLVGASVGCSVAMDYASRDRSVDAIACLSPGTGYMGLDAMGFIRKYGDRPILLISSEAERTAADQFGHEVIKATVQIVPGPRAGEDETALHGTRMLGKVPGIEEKIADFLKRAAGPYSKDRVVASLKGKVYYEPGSGQARRLAADNVRWFSSPTEAEARGLRAPADRGRPKDPRKTEGSRGNGKVQRPPDNQ
jgi:dienelactone hydrolase